MNSELRGAYEVATGRAFLQGVDLRSEQLPRFTRSITASLESDKQTAAILTEQFATRFDDLLNLNAQIYAQRLEGVSSSWSDSLESTRAMLTRDDVTRSLLSDTNAFVASMSRAMVSAWESQAAISRFDNSLSAEILKLAREARQAEEKEQAAKIKLLFDLIAVQVIKITGRISLEGWVQIILAIAMYVQGNISSERSHKQVMEKLDGIEAQLKTIAVASNREPAAELRMVVSKTLRVREAPAANSKIITRLTQGVLVRVLAEEKAWAAVEYFDFVEARSKTGWVAKQHLMELPDDFEDEQQPAPQR
jgi:SH3 domain-containing protein